LTLILGLTALGGQVSVDFDSHCTGQSIDMARNKRGTARSVPALIADDPPYMTFHLWMLIAVASLFAFFVTFKTGGLGFMLENDSTYLSVAVMLFFVSTTLYCGQRAWRLGHELLVAQGGGKADDGHSWVSAYLQASAGRSDIERTLLTETLTERLRGTHQVGWFITESLTKLGLLGTVIGFLIMLSALIGSSSLDITSMQGILREMASGMGIKIIATVVGLLCNMVLALQWVLLDRCADKILGAAMYLAAGGAESATAADAAATLSAAAA
jgi:hypothetical protein